jgi:hypothetical protein
MRSGAKRKLVHVGETDTHGAARKAGLHLACGHDDKALPPSDCILSNVGGTALPVYPSLACRPATLHRRSLLACIATDIVT